MFRFAIVIILSGFLYLGFEFVSAYKANNLTDTEVSQQITQAQAEAEREAKQDAERETQIRLNRQELWDHITTPVWELDTAKEKYRWVVRWALILGVLFFAWLGMVTIRERLKPKY